MARKPGLWKMKVRANDEYWVTQFGGPKKFFGRTDEVPREEALRQLKEYVDTIRPRRYWWEFIDTDADNLDIDVILDLRTEIEKEERSRDTLQRRVEKLGQEIEEKKKEIEHSLRELVGDAVVDKAKRRYAARKSRQTAKRPEKVSALDRIKEAIGEEN